MRPNPTKTYKPFYNKKFSFLFAYYPIEGQNYVCPKYFDCRIKITFGSFD